MIVLITFSPVEEDICRDGEVPLAVKHNNAVLGDGKIGVTFPVVRFAVILKVHPFVNEHGQHQLVDKRPALAVEDQNLGRISNYQEVSCNQKVRISKVSISNINKSYDDSVKLKRTEMDPFRLC